MNKKLLLGVVGLLLVGGATALLLYRHWNNHDVSGQITDAEVHDARLRLGEPMPAMQSVPQPIPLKETVRLAIGGLGLPDDVRNRELGDLTLTELSSAKGLELVERQQLDAALQETALSLSGFVRAKDAVRAGKLLRADWFLFGTPAVVNGTNVTVIRIVDARTGIMRDATMIPSGVDASALASKLAAFVRQSRQEAENPKPKTFLAIGSFEDLSLNSRQATLPRELRSYLTAVYQKSGVAMLEREYVNALLQEVYLDLAGLTEESATNAPKPMQAAYWMVDGFYQSYETTEFQVELVLNIRRVFGRNQQVALREKPGDALFKKVKAGIDDAMNRDLATLSPTRMTEVRAQLATGIELLESVKTGSRGNVSDWIPYTGSLSANEVARHRRNTLEAIRAFETVLLLDPNHRQAKASLAECLQKPFINRGDEARDLYREILESPVTDRWTGSAQRALVESFRWISPDEKRRWFAIAAERNPSESAREFYQIQMKAAAEEVVLENHGTSEAERVAEERLFRDMQSWEKHVRDRFFMVDFDNTGLGKYAEVFGTNQALAAERLAALLPKLQSASTNLAPYIFAGVVTFQVDTNAPIIAEFERSLVGLPEKAQQYLQPSYYVELLASPVYRWAEEHKLYGLAARTKEIRFQMAGRDRSLTVDAEDRMGLAFNYLRAESWQKALDIFQSYSNRPVLMGNSGLWGKAFTPIITSRQVTLCRRKLGLPPQVDAREFEMGDSCLCLHEPSAFAVDAGGLWIAIGNELLRLTFDLKTNASVRLPISGAAPITTLCLGASNVWVGTDGGGLIEVDRATRQCRRFGEQDGLLMDQVAALHLAGDDLWIGYGHGTGGGLGRLELSTRRFTSFTRSLLNSDNDDQPPDKPVFAITTTSDGEVLMLGSGSTLRRFRLRENIWRTVPKLRGECLVADSEQLFLGQYESQFDFGNGKNRPCELGIQVMNLKDGHVVEFAAAAGLPCSAVTAMAMDGRNLWLGGAGFIACVDAKDRNVRKLAYVNTRGIEPHGVEQIQIGGGYVWAQFDKHLYRAALSDIR